MITQSRQYNNQQLTIVSRHDTTIAKSNVDDKRVSTNPAPVVDIEFPKKRNPQSIRKQKKCFRLHFVFIFGWNAKFVPHKSSFKTKSRDKYVN